MIAFQLLLVPGFAQESPDTQAPGLQVQQWNLPGQGAGPLVVNPADGSLWTCLMQTWNLVALDGSDGSIKLNVPFNLAKREEHGLDDETLTVPDTVLNISPTSIAFSTDGLVGFIAGEPTSDQVIASGLVQAFDPSTGAMTGQLELDGACNAVFAAPGDVLYVAAGMQYGYHGKLYKIKWNRTDRSFAILNSAETGKIPWAIQLFDGNLYVTDLELQWTAQPDGSMGPPYGGWVWVYEAGSLQFVGKIWVGINPCRLAGTRAGVLVACSGSKQTEGQYEPAVVLLRGPDAADSEYIFVGTSGATDIAAPAEGNWAVVSLADWVQAPDFSQAWQWSQRLGGVLPEARRWVYTGNLALIDLAESPIQPQPVKVVDEAYVREVAVSRDGAMMYLLTARKEDDSEVILAVPSSLIRNPLSQPIWSGNQ